MNRRSASASNGSKLRCASAGSRSKLSQATCLLSPHDLKKKAVALSRCSRLSGRLCGSECGRIHPCPRRNMCLRLPHGRMTSRWNPGVCCRNLRIGQRDLTSGARAKPARRNNWTGFSTMVSNPTPAAGIGQTCRTHRAFPRIYISASCLWRVSGAASSRQRHRAQRQNGTSKRF